MKIVTCYKLIPEEQDIAINNDGSLNLSRAEAKISPFDLSAVEAANNLKKINDNLQITALSVGGEALLKPKGHKDILSRGPDELVIVSEPNFENNLPKTTATILAATVKQIGFDLILCGDGSGDIYAQQVGLLLGEELNIPAINNVSNIINLSDDHIQVERTLEDEIETLNIPLPAVISVSTDINTPQIPSMKSILTAAKKPVKTLQLNELGLDQVESYTRLLSVKAPKQKERKQIIIEGDGDEQITEFADHIRKIIG